MLPPPPLPRALRSRKLRPSKSSRHPRGRHSKSRLSSSHNPSKSSSQVSSSSSSSKSSRHPRGRRRGNLISLPNPNRLVPHRELRPNSPPPLLWWCQHPQLRTPSRVTSNLGKLLLHPLPLQRPRWLLSKLQRSRLQRSRLRSRKLWWLLSPPLNRHLFSPPLNKRRRH